MDISPKDRILANTAALSDMISYENKHTAFLVLHKHESH